MQNKTSQQVVNQAEVKVNGPVELDASLLHLVGGGAPKGTWNEVDAPKGTWNDVNAPKGTWNEPDAPKGTW